MSVFPRMMFLKVIHNCVDVSRELFFPSLDSLRYNIKTWGNCRTMVYYHHISFDMHREVLSVAFRATKDSTDLPAAFPITKKETGDPPK